MIISTHKLNISPCFPPLLKEKLSTCGLVLATTNLNKVRELKELFANFKLGIQVRALNEIPAIEASNFSVKEDGPDFRTNAIIKAKACFAMTNQISLADDSGLSVDALNGRPGVHSARYGGPALSDQQRCKLLLKELKEVSPAKRNARFSCVLALCSSIDEFHLFEDKVEGYILENMQGLEGFGYDPIFMDTQTGLSFAEIDSKTKNQRSHRTKAMQGLAKALRSS